MSHRYKRTHPDGSKFAWHYFGKYGDLVPAQSTEVQQKAVAKTSCLLYANSDEVAVRTLEPRLLCVARSFPEFARAFCKQRDPLRSSSGKLIVVVAHQLGAARRLHTSFVHVGWGLWWYGGTCPPARGSSGTCTGRGHRDLRAA